MTTIETLGASLLITAVSVTAAFALARSGRREDRIDGNDTEFARLQVRVASVESTVAKLEHASEVSTELLHELTTKVELIRQTLSGTTPSTGVLNIVEEIRKLVEEVKHSQSIDHDLITRLSERVRELERLLYVNHLKGAA